MEFKKKDLILKEFSKDRFYCTFFQNVPIYLIWETSGNYNAIRMRFLEDVPISIN